MADIKDLKITEDKTRGKHVADLPVNPTENGMSAQELQGRFDALPEVVIEAFNTLLDYLVENGAGDNITALTVGALPITGGKLTGNLYLNDKVQMGGNENAFLVSSNAKDGSYRQLQVTNSGYMTSVKNAIRLRDSLSNQTYNIYGEHNKPTAFDLGVLPLDGSVPMSGALKLGNGFSHFNSFAYGTIIDVLPSDLNYNKRFSLWLKPSDTVALAYSLNLFDGENSKEYKIFGEHNKPSGSYTGNGSAAERKITADAIGGNVIITRDGYSTLLMQQGAISLHNGTVTGIQDVWTEGGGFKLKTTNVALNENGVTYYYRYL